MAGKAGKKEKPKAKLELFGVAHVGWRDSLDFAHRLSRGRFDTVFVEAVPSSHREAKEVGRLLRSGRAVPYSPYILLEEEFFAYLNYTMWMLPKVVESVKHVANLDASPTGRDLPYFPVERWLEHKAVGRREVWRALMENVLYLLERDAIALTTLSITPFRRAIAWRGSYHIPSIDLLLGSSFSHLADKLSVEFIYSNYYVSTAYPMGRFSPEVFPYLFDMALDPSREKDGEALLLLAHHLLTLLHAGEPLPEFMRDYRRGFLVTFTEEEGEVEISMPPLWRRLGFSYPFVERVKVVPHSVLERLWNEKVGPLAGDIAEQWMGKRGKAVFTDGLMWKAWQAYSAYLDALFQYLGGLEGLKVKVEPKI